MYPLETPCNIARWEDQIIFRSLENVFLTLQGADFISLNIVKVDLQGVTGVHGIANKHTRIRANSYNPYEWVSYAADKCTQKGGYVSVFGHFVRRSAFGPVQTFHWEKKANDTCSTKTAIGFYITPQPYRHKKNLLLRYSKEQNYLFSSHTILFRSDPSPHNQTSSSTTRPKQWGKHIKGQLLEKFLKFVHLIEMCFAKWSCFDWKLF